MPGGVIVGDLCLCCCRPAFNVMCGINCSSAITSHCLLILNPNDQKNYRPVSNLPFISKLLEKIVLLQLNSHLSNNFHPFQSAYRSNHRTETVLLHSVNDLLLTSDSGKVSLLTLLDLSAAFDTIDHSILLSSEHTFGIHNTVLAWFTSYRSL